MPAEPLPYYFKTGTDEERLASTQHAREGHITSDKREFFVGSTQIVLNTGDTFAAGGDQTDTISMDACRREHMVLVQPSSAELHENIELQSHNGDSVLIRRAWDRVVSRVEMPANATTVVEFFDDNSGGSSLITLTGDAAKARIYLLLFVFDGANWQIWDNREIPT